MTTSTIESFLEDVSGILGGSSVLDTQAVKAISGLSTGNIESAVKSLASAMGTELAQSHEYITAVYEHFEDQAINYIQKKHKVNGEAAIVT